jgi:CDP-diacylglycerol--glycerol-3-phosphate 3-phosphatidyltransferase
VTAFGKLMDPLADKLLIVAALLSLVSLHRLAAWVAMVIITRELAVTMLRMGATHAGVVIGASVLGKAKTVVQILTVLAVIAVSTQPWWLTVAIYVMVAVTVISGLDYIFGLRRHMQAARSAAVEAVERSASAGPSSVSALAHGSPASQAGARNGQGPS